jgi:hypothetical protein
MAMSDDELLDPRPAIANDALREELLMRTARRVRFRRWWRYGKQVGLSAICFAAGAAAMLARPTPSPSIVYVDRDVPPPAVKIEPPAEPPRPRSAAELELEAEKATVKAESARRFRQAGDHYIRDHADVQSALRCYRNFLDEADPADLPVSREDTWLLTSLKRAREQENSP